MGNNQHLKRHSAPTSWGIKRKATSFVAKPNAGSHKAEYVVPLVVVLRDILRHAETSKEVKLILHNSEVLVNGKRVQEIRFPVGIFDVLEIKATSEKYTALFDELGKIKLVPVKDDLIYLKLSGKTQVSGGKFQLNFMNGFNTLVDEKVFKSVKVEDTVVFDFTKKKVASVIPLKEGSFVYFFDGKFQGKFGEVKEFAEFNGLTRNVVKVQVGSDVQNTAKDYAFAIGTKKEDLKRFN